MKLAMFLPVLFFAGIGVAFAAPVSSEIPSGQKTHFVDEQIMITADISNNQDVQQNFAYITQVTDDEGVVVSLSWLTGSLSPRQSFSPAQSWIPTESGTFDVQVFVWQGISDPQALSPPLSMKIFVSERSS